MRDNINKVNEVKQQLILPEREELTQRILSHIQQHNRIIKCFRCFGCGRYTTPRRFHSALNICRACIQELKTKKKIARSNFISRATANFQKSLTKGGLLMTKAKEDRLFEEPVTKNMHQIPETFNLAESDIKGRAESFIDENTLRIAGIRRVDDHTAREVLTRPQVADNKDFGGLWIPYFDIYRKGEGIRGCNIRRDNPHSELNEKGEKKAKLKYVKPRGQQIAYFPPGITNEMIEGAKEFVWTEGEFKALALARYATNDWTEDYKFIPIGLSGVDGFKTKRSHTDVHGEKKKFSGQLIELDLIKWKGSKHFVIFDSDKKDKPYVRAAERRFRSFLRNRRAKVFIIDFPPEFEGTKTKGIDDHLGAVSMSDGKDIAFERLEKFLDYARTPQKPNAVKHHNFNLVDYGESDKPGVYYEDETESFFVCDPLKIVARTRTDEGSGAGKVLAWRFDEIHHKWAMPDSYLHSDGLELARLLSDKGLFIPPNRKCREKLAHYIATAPAGKRIISTDKTGWHHSGVFVLPNETIGEGEEEIVYQSAYDTPINFSRSGSIEDWKKEVAGYCVNNPLLTFAVSCSFASPLLHILQIQGNGFNFRGLSSLGKTTALIVAGSVWGGDPDGGYIQTWKATSNGLEIVAKSHNHALLCLDEIGECEPREIGKIVYMLPNGKGKIRMNKTREAQKVLTWKLIFISTGEATLEEKLSEAGQIPKAGQEVRFCDIEIDGKYGIFDDLHGFSNGGLLSDHLRESASKYYGTASREFVEMLSEQDSEELREAWHKFKAEFEKEVLPEKHSPEVLRVASKFALIAFAGRLASIAEVTGWEVTEAVTAAEKLFKLWLANRGSGQSDIDRGVQQVVSFLQTQESRFQNIDSDAFIPPNNRAGYIRESLEENKNGVSDISGCFSSGNM